MRIYLRGVDGELWAVVRKGHVPMEDEDEEEWKEEQKILSLLDSRAMHILLSALYPKERSQVAQCESAKEIWESLQTTHEDTPEVKDSRIDVLLNEYESFEMSSGESISSMYKRFNDLINRLKGLGKMFETIDLVRKILRCLPREWLPKRTAIEEAKDLNTLSIERLVGSLLSHEEVIIQMNKDDHRRRKVIAFKAQEYDSDSEVDMGEEFEKEFAPVSRNFHRMLKMKKDFKAKRA
ncbi:unnamed protein product [Linum trigynum]|uniref:UBN2 domain-containing protein n=1 Tax=Linum trigynum TaxID=586398 RepID=A0AAV2DW12_9ROSI